MSFISSGPEGQMRFLGQEVGNLSAAQGAALSLCYLFCTLVELIAELNWVRLLPAHAGSKANASLWKQKPGQSIVF